MKPTQSSPGPIRRVPRSGFRSSRARLRIGCDCDRAYFDIYSSSSKVRAYPLYLLILLLFQNLLVLSILYIMLRIIYQTVEQKT